LDTGIVSTADAREVSEIHRLPAEDGYGLVERFLPAGPDAPARITAIRGRRATGGEQRQIDLVDMTSIDASTMSRLVTRLVRMGLVTRSRSATSNREVVVELSPKGRVLVQRLIPIAKKLEQTASAGLPSKDLAVAKRALSRMYDNLVSGG